MPARIVASEVQEVSCFEDQLMFRPEVRYTYAAGGGEATGRDLAFAGKLYPTRERAVRALAPYPVGMVVMARLNPDDPIQVVLVRCGGLAGLLDQDMVLFRFLLTSSRTLFSRLRFNSSS